MDNPRLAGRYAKSLIDLATEQNQLDAVCNDIRMLKSICTTNPDFTAILRSPIIQADKKEKIIAAVTNGRVANITAGFIQLLVTKGRESNLPEIINAFIDQFNELRNIYIVKITTAVSVSDEVKKLIVDNINATGKIGFIELETAVREELIGGFILETNNTLIDASILRDLKDVKKQFMNNEYIHRLR